MKKKLVILILLLMTGLFLPVPPVISGGKPKKKEKSRRSENYFTEGVKAYILGHMDEAEDWFLKSYEITPDNAGLSYMLAQVYFKKEDNNQALLYATKAVKLDEKNEYYHLLLADIYREQANIGEAIDVYKKMLSLFPEKEENYFNLASLYLYEGKTEDALNIYRTIGEKFGKTPELSRQMQELFIRTDNPDAALAESKSLAETFPEESSYLLSYAELLVNYKKIDEAKKILQEVIKNDPNNPYSRFILAQIYKHEGNLEAFFREVNQVFQNPEMELDTKISLLAEISENSLSKDEKTGLIQLAQSLTEAHPDNAIAYATLAEIYSLNNLKEKAWKAFLKAKDLDNTNYNLWSTLIILDSELSKVDSMIAHSEQALEVYPNQSGMWYLNGSAYLQDEKYKKAAESLEQGKKIAGNNNQLLLQFNILLGETYNNLKEYAQSDQSFDEALEIDKNNPHVLNNYSYFLSLRKENLQKALEMGEKLMKIAPENAAYLDTYAWVLYQLGRYEEAKTYLEKALEKTNDGTIIEHYGDVLYKLGQTDKAVEEWDKARKSGQTSNLIDKKIKDKKLYE